MAANKLPNSARPFRRGDAVTVRGLDEILATLDGDFKLDGLPFMPEMAPYCGQTFRVHRRADMTCVEGLGFRRMRNTVFLEDLRCNGAHHDGCQRGCLFFWNEAWLKPATTGDGQDGDGGEPKVSRGDAIENGPAAAVLPTMKGDGYYCQSTELATATSELTTGTMRRYLSELRTGDLRFGRLAYFVWMAIANRLWRLLYGRNVLQIAGDRKRTLSGELNLQPGELVEIKSAAEIQATLDERGRNRGLSFEPEMTRYCGRRYRVATPVRTIVAEETGKMLHLTNTVILDGVICAGLCSKNCPRTNYLYWREIWLKRVPNSTLGSE